MPKILKDILTEPNNRAFSFILVLGFLAFCYANILETIDVIKTHTFEVKDYLEGMAIFITSVGGVYTVQYGLNKFSPNKESETKEPGN